MKILNDSEHRIFLSAMSRERKVCKNEDFFDYGGVNKLLDICDSIERKVNDAEPVRHGHWFYDQHRWICSECHENPTFGMGYVQSERSLYNYCPDCGAKMDNAGWHMSTIGLITGALSDGNMMLADELRKIKGENNENKRS